MLVIHRGAMTAASAPEKKKILEGVMRLLVLLGTRS